MGPKTVVGCLIKTQKLQLIQRGREREREREGERGRRWRGTEGGGRQAGGWTDEERERDDYLHNDS